MSTVALKKQKTSVNNSQSKGIKKSKIFSPFRTIGHVSDGTPFAIGTLGATFYIVTIVGRSFQIYDASTLHLLFVSNKQTPDLISCVTARSHYVYCAYGNKIGVFRRGRLEYEMTVPNENNNPNFKVNKLLVFNAYLIACTDNKIFVFENKQPTDKFPSIFYTSSEINSLYGTIVDLIHMPTHMNKIVIATSKHLLVFNVKTGKNVFISTEFNESITTIAAAPVIDFLAIGTTEGICKIYNIKKAKTLKNINTGSKSLITSISFRTDGNPHLVCSLKTGDLFFYDLNKNSRVHLLSNIHKEEFGGVSKAQFLNGNPIIVTTGGDNSLKEFVFDPIISETNTSVITPPRHLRSRGGHSAPPTSILFSDENAHFIASGSLDRTFWLFSLRKDAQSQEMSQKEGKIKNGKLQAGASNKFKMKFPPIISIVQENSREGEWDNVLTAHQDELFARTWNSKNKKIGKYKLDTIDAGIVKSIAISQCGNFGFVGSSNGGIGVYNLQSGMLRKKYKLHKKSVTGISLDGMNRKMVSCGLDGIVGFYDFSQSKYLGKLTFESPITKLCYHRSSDLFAIVLDDLSIVVIDAVSQKVVRQLFGHTNRITAVDFSNDGRWLISASLDSTIRTWDLPTGSCIDGIKLPKVATSLKMSPNGEYLATAHVNDVGISLWTNKSQFKKISTKKIEDEDQFANMLLPNVSGEGGSSMIEGALEIDEVDIDEGIYISPQTLDNKLITFSNNSRNKFNSIIYLESIKQRNKTKEKPKKQENLPFFLELTGLKVGNTAIENEIGKDAVAKLNERQSEEDSGSKLLALDKSKEYQFETDFTKLLRLRNFDEFIELIVTMSPSSIDFEIKSLSLSPPYTELISFFNAIKYGLQTNVNIEILIAVVFVFLQSHSDVIYGIKKLALESNDKDAQNAIYALNELQNVNLNVVEKLDELCKYCSSVVNFITTT
jgi:U3 small nucleolar RNA-associated protein 21